MRRFWYWIPLLLIGSATPASAQLCRGGPSFAAYPYQVGALVRAAGDTRAFGGNFAVGGRYLFAGAGFSARRADEADTTAAEVSSLAGLELRVSQVRRIFFCPVAFVAFGTGPDRGDTDVSTFDVGGGGRVGVVVRDSDALQIVPVFGVDAVRRRSALELNGTEEDETDGYGVAALGVGFIINRRFAITPEAGVPFSAADSDVMFTLRIAYGFE